MVSLHSLNNKFSKFSRFTLNEKCAFIAYLFTFPLFLLVFRTIGLKKTKKYAEFLIARVKSNINRNDIDLINHSKIINSSLVSCIIKSTCLEKSLFTYLALGLKGFSSELKIGIINYQKDFQAHAWVESNGLIVNDNIENLNNIPKFGKI